MNRHVPDATDQMLQQLITSNLVQSMATLQGLVISLQTLFLSGNSLQQSIDEWIRDERAFLQHQQAQAQRRREQPSDSSSDGY